MGVGARGDAGPAPSVEGRGAPEGWTGAGAAIGVDSQSVPFPLRGLPVPTPSLSPRAQVLSPPVLSPCHILQGPGRVVCIPDLECVNGLHWHPDPLCPCGTGIPSPRVPAGALLTSVVLRPQ